MERDEKSLFEPCSKVFVMIAQREREREREREKERQNAFSFGRVCS